MHKAMSIVAWSWLTGIIFPLAALAHDTWLIGVPAVVESGGTVKLRLFTGETFPLDEQTTDPSRVAEWTVVAQAVAHRVEEYGIDGDTLAATVRAEHPGVAVAAIALKPRYLEMEGTKFEEYLTDEKAAEALAARQKSSDGASKPGREYYTKLAKTYFQVNRPKGAKDTGAEVEAVPLNGFDQPVGHPLEIIPLTNPFTWGAGDTIAVRVLLKGKPAKGLRVSSGHEQLPKHTFIENVVTDEEGVARFTLSWVGQMWFLRTHRIEPLDPPARRGGDDAPLADWESYFASMTFQIQPRKDKEIAPPKP